MVLSSITPVYAEEVVQNKVEKATVSDKQLLELSTNDSYITVSPMSSYSTDTAITLESGKTYYREYSSSWHSRKWVSKFVVEKNSYADISFTSKYHYSMSILDANGNMVMDLGSKKNYSTHLSLQEGTYYVVLTNSYSNNNIVLSYYLTSNVNCEIEPNDTLSNATRLELGKEYLAFTQKALDKDCFVFNSRNCKKIRIYFKNYEEIEPYIYLYNVNRIKINIINMQYDNAKALYYYEFTPTYEGDYFIEIIGSNGEKIYTVNVCRTECIHHEQTEIIESKKSPTCTEAGKSEVKKCKECQSVFGGEKIPANGHTQVIDAGIVATCTSVGKTEGVHCSVCHTVLIPQQEIPATGHTERIIKGVSATCKKAGKKDGAICSSCGVILHPQEQIAPTHKVKKWKTNKKATVLKAGQKTGKCTVCKKTVKVSIAKLPASIKVVSNVSVKAKKSKTIKVKYSKGDGIKSWTTNNKKIATVSKKGKVSGKKAGTAILTVKLKSGKTAKVTVTVY